jgi:hypothetical protein
VFWSVIATPFVMGFFKELCSGIRMVILGKLTAPEPATFGGHRGARTSQFADRTSCCCGSACRAATPINDFSFIDLEIVVVVCSKTGNFTNGAVDVEHDSALSTDQVMVIVANSILIARSGSWRLYSPQQLFVHEYTECVVDRLSGNGTNVSPNVFAQLISCDVR